jgi:hypothetical protein
LTYLTRIVSGSLWPCGLTHSLEAAQLLGSLFRNLRGHEYSSLMCVEFCADIGLCNELITLSEKSYCECVSNCVRSRILKNEAAKARFWLLRHKKCLNIETSSLFYLSYIKILQKIMKICIKCWYVMWK